MAARKTPAAKTYALICRGSPPARPGCGKPFTASHWRRWFCDDCQAKGSRSYDEGRAKLSRHYAAAAASERAETGPVYEPRLDGMRAVEWQRGSLRHFLKTVKQEP
jgi:hypothetical protein